MATETTDRGDTEGTPLPGGMTRLPNGVILDKDGKPCRACNTKSAFSSFVKQQSPAKSITTTSTTPSSTTASSATTRTVPAECPPDVEQLGRSSWTLLHSIAATYPEAPTRSQQSDLSGFVSLFARLYPCWVCAEDFKAYVAKDEPRVASRRDFGLWLCGAHNEVNRKLGKPEFDCARWEERWRTGPRDGSCD